MKKYLLLILSIFYINVNADTYYTDYHLIESNSLTLKEEYLDNELYKIESKEGFNNYQEVDTFLGYYTLDKPPIGFTYYDLNDYMELWNYAQTPFSKEDSIYNTNRIKRFTSAQSIQLRSFITNAYFRELKVYYQNKPINFTYTLNNYNGNEFLSSDNQIIIDLGMPYELDKLRIEILFYDNKLSSLQFMLNTYPERYILGTQYDYYDNNLYRNKYSERYIINFLDSNNFNNLLKKLSWIKPRQYDDIYSVPYYKSPYYKFSYHQVNRVYSNTYTDEPLEGYTLDYSNSKTIYDYYQRDYIDIDEDNNITSSAPLEDIHTSTKGNLLIIEYDKFKFTKELKQEEAHEEVQEVVEKPVKEKKVSTIKKTTTRKTTTTKKATTTKVIPKPIAKVIKEESNTQESPTCKDNSLILKIYSIINSVLFIILSIMCKHYVFKKKK